MPEERQQEQGGRKERIWAEWNKKQELGREKLPQNMHK